jgi:hypothetical protein
MMKYLLICILLFASACAAVEPTALPEAPTADCEQSITEVTCSGTLATLGETQTLEVADLRSENYRVILNVSVESGTVNVRLEGANEPLSGQVSAGQPASIIGAMTPAGFRRLHLTFEPVGGAATNVSYELQLRSE